jgi:RimJ/RimL family protein N-acetyltransferase
LVDFTPRDVERIEHWFDEQETKSRLGGRDWIRNEMALLGATLGDEFRGKLVTGRMMWLALDANDEPVAFVDGETYDRYTAWDGSDWDHPIVSDVVEVPSIGLALVVDPARRRSGYGTATLRAVVDHPDVSHVRLFFGGVDHDNVASIACLERSGFRPRSTEPDFEGMVYYALER